MDNYQIRRLTRYEMDNAVEWAAKEGWNPGLHDADCFYNADPKGWWGGFLNDKLIATISAVDYGNKFAFVGFYIVHPEYRGKGYGYKLWRESLASIEHRNIGLDGVIAEQENYKKSGFKLAYRNMRFEGASAHFNMNDSSVVDFNTEYVDSVIKYDKKFFPDDRSEFIKYWLGMKDSYTVCYIDKNLLKGFGTIRMCGKGFKIGPLFCENNNIAETLFQKLQNKIPEGEFFYLDIPEPNAEAKAMVEKYNMNFVFETARMYTKEDPGLPVNKIFGVTTFELG